MLYISYGSVCELETQILLAGDSDLIEKGELSILKKISQKLDKKTIYGWTLTKLL